VALNLPIDESRKELRTADERAWVIGQVT